VGTKFRPGAFAAFVDVPMTRHFRKAVGRTPAAFLRACAAA
jgi:hypothetical protein